MGLVDEDCGGVGWEAVVGFDDDGFGSAYGDVGAPAYSGKTDGIEFRVVAVSDEAVAEHGSAKEFGGRVLVGGRKLRDALGLGDLGEHAAVR